jgi:hypothetical protein
MVANQFGKKSDASSLGVRNHVNRRRLLGLASTFVASTILPIALPRRAISQTLNALRPEPLTAIDILLDPDQTMVEKAIAANARLRQSFPKGVRFGRNAPAAHFNVAAVRQDARLG